MLDASFDFDFDFDLTRFFNNTKLFVNDDGQLSGERGERASNVSVGVTLAYSPARGKRTIYSLWPFCSIFEYKLFNR